jgi:hypothetical protein
MDGVCQAVILWNSAKVVNSGMKNSTWKVVGRLAPAAIMFFAFVASAMTVVAQDTSAIVGRWDLTVFADSRQMPSWLEVQPSGFRMLVGRFVGGGGSARPISRVGFSAGRLSFTIPPQWEAEDRDLTVEGVLQGDSLTGTMTLPNGKSYQWVGVRAPVLKRSGQPVWGTPIKLFDGVDLKGWHASGPVNQWKAESGVLRSPASGSNLITDQKFNDFKLHIEFRFPKGSNSGVYLRGRYELQIEDDEVRGLPNDVIGSIYGFLPPSEEVSKGPGEWQTYDVTLIGRMVTVKFNGKTVICDREIPGITGGALNSHEAETGPIYLQGDHGPVEYRNIELTPAK